MKCQNCRGICSPKIRNIECFSLDFCSQNYTDTGLRNIIDKLAEFVARNGPEFESITKLKQQGNPRFSFLYGGDYYQYYQWRVGSEQARRCSDIIHLTMQNN